MDELTREVSDYFTTNAHGELIPRVVCVPLRIYVLGKMSANSAKDMGLSEATERNVAMADNAAQEIFMRGHYPFCPHTQSRTWFNRPESKFHSYYDVVLGLDFNWLGVCDAGFYLPSWTESKGAKLEDEYIVQHGLWKFFSLDELPDVDTNESREFLMYERDKRSWNCRRRLILGAIKYGESWLIDDSNKDAEEEQWDRDNYDLFVIARRKWLESNA